MNLRSAATRRRKQTFLALAALAATGGSCCLIGASAYAQDDMPMPAAPAASSSTTTTFVDSSATSTEAATVPESQQRAANLIDEAISVAYQNPAARSALARGAAALIPQLDGRSRRGLANRWVPLISTDAVPRAVSLSAFSAFFDGVAQMGNRADWMYGREVAMMLPDPVARAGGLLRLSEAAEDTDWSLAADLASLSQRAARQEPDLVMRARTLTYVANRLASLNPETREAAIIEASSQARLITANDTLRASLLASVAGSAAKFDIPLANRIADSITVDDMKKLALARIAAAQTQASFAVKAPDTDRVATIVGGVSRYDSSFIPVLLQLPSSPEVLQALGDALPPIKAGVVAPIDASTLESVWSYSAKAEAGIYRDQLQSRVARLMVLHDLWRGRAWGQKLAWEGGRNQIAQFVNDTVAQRQSQLDTEVLRSLAANDLNRATLRARNLPPLERVQALLLLAGQSLLTTS